MRYLDFSCDIFHRFDGRPRWELCKFVLHDRRGSDVCICYSFRIDFYQAEKVSSQSNSITRNDWLGSKEKLFQALKQMWQKDFPVS